MDFSNHINNAETFRMKRLLSIEEYKSKEYFSVHLTYFSTCCWTTMIFATSTHVLFSLLILSIIVAPIWTFYLQELVPTSDQTQDEDQQPSHQIRSVLLPKICITLSKKSNELHIHPNINTRQSRQQSKRKCYPFDMR